MARFDSKQKAYRWFDDYFMHTARIVAGDCWSYQTDPSNPHRYTHVQTYTGRDWFKREYNRYQLHPAISDMVVQHCYCPDNWHQLLLEWPHKSETDPNRLAYTRDERAGEADRQVVTTIGKYLMRHFPDAPDHLIRDIASQYNYEGSITITNNLDEMIHAVSEGPASCMSKDFNLRCTDGKRRHPYAVYDPQHGWSMAVRRDNADNILGRCLLWTDPDNGDTKHFVRSYKRERDSYAHSGTDEAIEAYLKTIGFTKRNYWEDGARLAAYDLSDGGYLMPYIDGGTQKVSYSHKYECMYIDDCGDYDADNTDGSTDDTNCTCDDCGARYNDDDEGGWTGVSEDNHVCGSCLDHSYTYAYSRRGNQYYIHNHNVVWVHDEAYDTDYLSDNNIVELHDGEYEHMDNAVYIDSVDEYYHCDDEDICYAEDTNQYELKDNCWYCEGSNRWYTDDEDYVEIDGITYHPDHAPEIEDETETTEDETN